MNKDKSQNENFLIINSHSKNEINKKCKIKEKGKENIEKNSYDDSKRKKSKNKKDKKYKKYKDKNTKLNIYTNSKHVKFKKIIFVDIECWKKYNLEQTADENLEVDYEDDESFSHKSNENENIDSDILSIKSKIVNTTCTCIII